MNRNIPTRLSRSRVSAPSSHRRTKRPGLCSCTEARARRAKAAASVQEPVTQPVGFTIPVPLRMDQNEICVALEQAMLAGGKTASAAKELREVLQPHLLREEEHLLQLLGLLVPLAQGQISSTMRNIPSKTEHLKTRMFEIVREHAAIIQAARKLLRAANSERKLKLAEFTEHLMLRAWTDEVVFYPAAVLIGEYLKLKFGE
jgi:hypothetical protein